MFNQNIQLSLLIIKFNLLYFVELTLNQMSEEEENTFKNFPIYIFANSDGIYTEK